MADINFEAVYAETSGSNDLGPTGALAVGR